MSEIKFACPHCSQHITCDDLYCGEKILCPGCDKEMFVPQRAAFIPLQSGNLTMELPVASKGRQPAHAVELGLWGKTEWDERASQSGVNHPSSVLPLWILLFLPFVAAFVLAIHRIGPESIGYVFLLCALVGGFYLAKIQNKSGGELILMGFLYAIAALMFYVIIAVGLLFLGCLAIAFHG
jgi:hypothetical protein